MSAIVNDMRPRCSANYVQAVQELAIRLFRSIENTREDSREGRGGFFFSDNSQKKVFSVSVW